MRGLAMDVYVFERGRLRLRCVLDNARHVVAVHFDVLVVAVMSVIPKKA